MKIKINLFCSLLLTAILLTACNKYSDNFEGQILYRCGKPDISVLADFTPNDTLILSIMGEKLELDQAGSKSDRYYQGLRYNGADVLFQRFDRKAILSIDRLDRECVPVVANPVEDIANFKALGHEPEWMLTLGETGLRFYVMGQKVDITVKSGDFELPAMTDGLLEFNPAKDMEVDIKETICQDNMNGQYHKYSIQVTYKDKAYKGCGFGVNDPKQALMAI